MQTAGYTENVPATPWLYALTYGLLLVFVAVMIAGAVTGRIEGAEAAVFYPVMIIGGLILAVVARSFLTLRITVDAEGLQFGFGRFRKTFAPDQVSSAEPQRYSFRKYLGWGIRYAFNGDRAWSILGAPEGVYIRVHEDNTDHGYFISSRRPQELADAIHGLIS